MKYHNSKTFADPNWNVVATTNASGTVQERMRYDAFGRITWLNASFATKTNTDFAWNRTFTGQVLDAESALMLYRNRYYHSGLGRFVSRDPIGYDAGDENLYRYVNNLPQILLDSFGLFNMNECIAEETAICRQQYPGVRNAIGRWGCNAGVSAVCAARKADAEARAAAQSICDLVDAANTKEFRCLCLIAGVADMIPGIGNNPAVEALDCTCNIVATLNVGCKKGLAAGALYGALTAIDCTSFFSSPIIGCELGTVAGGIIGAGAGGFGAVPGSLIGCLLGRALADSAIDATVYAMQNAISQDSNSIFPHEALCDCKEFFGL